MTSPDFDLRQGQTDKMLLAQAEANPRHTTCGENGDSCRCFPGQCKFLNFRNDDNYVPPVEDLWRVR